MGVPPFACGQSTFLSDLPQSLEYRIELAVEVLLTTLVTFHSHIKKNNQDSENIEQQFAFSLLQLSKQHTKILMLIPSDRDFVAIMSSVRLISQ